MERKGLVVYFLAGFICAYAALRLAGEPKSEPVSFDEITVHRINVVEPTGTLRMVIANHASLYRGEQPSRERPGAGMLFYNDEGAENGGLIFGGHKNEKGEVVDSGGSLTFDKYGASQIVQLAGVDDIHDHFSGLRVNEFPSPRELYRRIWVGRDASGTASVALMDSKGRKRLVMQVLQDGTSSILFLDEHGKAVNQITPVSPQ